MEEPAWRNGLQEEDIADWTRHRRSPPALAAVQWRRVVRSTRAEAAGLAPDRYAEVHYERFVEEPGDTLDAIASFCQLPASAAARDFLEQRFELRNMNYQWTQRFDADWVAMLNELMGTTLAELGYGVDPPRPPEAAPRLGVPFAGS